MVKCGQTVVSDSHFKVPGGGVGRLRKTYSVGTSQQGLVDKRDILLQEWACRGAEDSAVTTRESPATVDE